MKDLALWNRLLSFELDSAGAEFPFSKRLARDCGWSHGFALSVIQEYKRFLYLAMVCGHGVTPSEEVDEAWHLHLCYTRSYWEELCMVVLGRPLHHGPTKGGPEQARHFLEQYERTLASYALEFGEAAPQAVWPEAKIRFGGAGRRRMVDTAAHFILPKVWMRRISVSFLAALGGAAAIGCRETLFDTRGNLSGEVFPYLFIGVVVVIILVGIFKGGKGGGGGGCSTCGGGDSSGCGDSGCGGGGCGGGCGD